MYHMSEKSRSILWITCFVILILGSLTDAAVSENNSRQAGRNAVKWFWELGAKDIVALPVIDAKTANDLEFSAELERAGLIFILGGSPGYLEKTLRKSRCLDALWDAYQKEVIIAGSSAGAMILCEKYFDPLYATHFKNN